MYYEIQIYVNCKNLPPPELLNSVNHKIQYYYIYE